MDVFQKIRSLSTSPGVYLFKNAAAEVIYVGKAKDLRARVRTYFLPGQWESAKTGSLLREAADLETIVVDSEAEALALENNLIKRLQPRFNILLRDDKTYPYIRLSRERYPRVYVTRRLVEDGSEYFGPFFPTGFAYRLVHFVHKHFLVPSCRIDLTRSHPRPCLQFHIHRCLGPCVDGLTTETAYEQAVRDVRLFLSGRQSDLARGLKARRDAAAAAENFELAAGYRDLLTVLDDVQARQKMHALSGDDADIVGFYREGARAALHIFHLRHGRILDRREFFWEDLPPVLAAGGGEAEAGEAEAAPAAAALPQRPLDERLGALLKQIYLQQPYLPPVISIPADFEDRELLQAALSLQRQAPVEIALPQRGAKKAMIELARKNAENSFTRRFRAAAPAELAAERLEALRQALQIRGRLARIECFDVSHFQGAETVASMVVWDGAGMRRADYRKFRIRGVTGVDDFRSIEEAVGRRYRRLTESQSALPDLVLIDGGLGQLHAAQRALAALGLERQPLASIAKREEIIYVAGRESAPLRLDPSSPLLHIVQTIRDESHRFALAFHRQRRGAQALRSPLLEVAGIGPATVRQLLRHFGSLAAVEAAAREQLDALLPAARAAALWVHLHPAPVPAAAAPGAD